MKKVYFFRAAALTAGVFLAACGGGSSDSDSDDYAINEAGGLPAGYSLVWADEFSVDGLPDATRWAYDVHANSFGWYNHEWQYYANARADNSRVESGMLIIEARKESAAGFPDHRASAPQQYTSARLITQGKASWTYGFIEVMAKVPCGQGTWPAIWMLADVPSLQWPLDGEIDLMEHVNNIGEIHFSVHTQDHNHVQRTQATNQNPVAVCDGSFHKYQLTWTANEVVLGMDDRNYLRYRNEGRGRSQWPFNGPQYLLLNIAVGGDWPGPPSPSTVFPVQMQVDYVRVYSH